MATPNPVGEGETIEQYRAKLVKSNTGDVEKHFRRVFPDQTDEQIGTLGRHGMIEKLVEHRRSEMGIPAPQVVVPGPVVPGVDPGLAQIIQLLMAQQAATAEERKAERKAEKEKEEKRLLAEKEKEDRRLAAEERRLVEEKAERKAAAEKEEARLKEAIEREERRWQTERAEKAALLEAEQTRLLAEIRRRPWRPKRRQC